MSAPDTALSRVRIVVFDTETTGLSPVDDVVIEIAALSLEGGVETGRFETLVDPGRPIPPELTDIHGIDDAMVRGKPRLAEAGPRFLEFAADSILAAHNAAYDMAMLIGPLLEAGHEPAGNAVLDTCRLARRLIDSPNYQLGTIAGTLGKDISRAHRAMPDAEATASVLLECLARMGEGATLADAERIGAMRLVFGLAPELASGRGRRVSGAPLDGNAPATSPGRAAVPASDLDPGRSAVVARGEETGAPSGLGTGTPASHSAGASAGFPKSGFTPRSQGSAAAPSSSPPGLASPVRGPTGWLQLFPSIERFLDRYVRPAARPDPVTAIARALGGQKTVEIVYRGGSHGDRPRRITPLFFLELDDQLNVAALCHYDRVLKNFRVSQIESARPI